MKVRKILCLIVVLAMFVSYTGTTLSTSAAEIESPDSAASITVRESKDTAKYGDFEYSVLNNGTIEISGYTGSGGNITIPGTINGKKVTSIGGWAFERCYNLTNITIPNSVTSIGYDAFGYCTSLQNITVSSNIRSIGDFAFDHCVSLTSVTVPGTVSIIGKAAFQSCTSLQSLTVQNGVKEIGEYAFNYCSALSSVTVPKSVTNVGIAAFSNCDKLSSIAVDSNNSYYTSSNGVLFNKAKNTLLVYPAGKTGAYNIPYGVTTIKESAFSGCSGLTDIGIPDSVTTIEGWAFFGCTELKSVTIPNRMKTIYAFTFEKCRNITVTIPKSVTNIESLSFDECENITINGFQNTAAETFANDNNIPFVTIKGVYGDVNGDGRVTVIDAFTVERYCALFQTLTSEQLALADVDNNGTANLVDALILQRYTATFTNGSGRTGQYIL